MFCEGMEKRRCKDEHKSKLVERVYANIKDKETSWLSESLSELVQEINNDGIPEAMGQAVQAD